MGAEPSNASETRTAYDARDLGPPTAGRVFGEYWWRSLALATAGGSVIGVVVGPVSILSRSYADRTLPIAALAAFAGAAFGAAVGVLLGAIAGVLIGAAGALWLVPYPGEAATKWTLRVVAMATVALWFLVLAQENVYSDLKNFDLWAIVVPSLTGTWFVAPWVGGWYVDRMSDLP